MSEFKFFPKNKLDTSSRIEMIIYRDSMTIKEYPTPFKMPDIGRIIKFVCRKQFLRVTKNVNSRWHFITRESMKKQELCIFYIADEKDELEFKLAKTYTNRFCIDEEDQSEIYGFHQITKKFYKAKYYSTAAFMKHVKLLLFDKVEVHREAMSTIGPGAETGGKTNVDKYSKHLIFVLPILVKDKHTDYKLQRDFTNFVSLGATRHWYEILESTRKTNFTLLNGRIAKSNQTYETENQERFTIGDDIDLMYNQLKSENFKTFKNKGSSLIANVESCMEIKYKRESVTAITREEMAKIRRRAIVRTVILSFIIFVVISIVISLIVIVSWVVTINQ